jgi:uncharacterized membrane protein YhaH (DUF805 family)
VDVLKKYAVFSGRARRQEYWMFFLFSVIASIVLAIIDAILGTSILQWLYVLATLIPSLAVGVRRLHDTNRSGWWVLISLVPIVGTIILIVFMASEGNPEETAHGPNPKLAPAF